eukprot:GHVQ01028598.1.p1 GENE.GHVQ01028598.1~~GHVQ01028598.1.p1  ORF type:complete len:300 (-),score=24.31 GHVQ01028598.1:169-1068(-)
MNAVCGSVDYCRFRLEHAGRRYDWFLQVMWIGYRTTLNSVRNPVTCLAQFIIQAITGLLLGGIFWQLDKLQQPAAIIANDMLGLLFFMTCNFGFSGFGTLLEFPQERLLVNRETANNMYSVSAYFIGKTIADLPYQQLPPLLQMVFVYWMSGMRRDATAFFVFLMVNSVCVFASSGYMYLVSTVTPNMFVGNLVAPLLLMIFMLLSGFYLSDSSIPPWIGWLRYASFLRFTFFALSGNQFPPDQDTIPGFSNNEFLSSLGEPDFRVWFNIGLTFVLAIVFRIVAFVFLTLANRRVGVES